MGRLARSFGPGLALMAMTMNGASGSAATVDKAQLRAAADRETFQKASAAARLDDCVTVMKLLKPRLGKKPAIEPEQLEAYAFELAALCAARQQDPKTARALALAGTALPAATDRLWLMRLRLELVDQDFRAAVVTAEAMSNGRGKALNAVPIEWFGSLQQVLRDRKLPKERQRLLAVLANPAYVPDEIGRSTDGFRSEYAKLLMAAGDPKKAAEVVGTMESSALILQLSLDSRFKAMIPADFDERQRAEAELAKALAERRSHGDLLVLVLNASSSLRALGRPEEAVKLLLSAKEQPGGLEAFKDVERFRNWWWDSLARSYSLLGDYEHMAEAYHQGALLKEFGGANVSQVINLAAAQVDYGKPREALATIAEFKLAERSTSSYGAMQMRFARGCASALAGDMGQARDDLGYIRSHEKDDPVTTGAMMLCMDDMDGAATLFVRLLGEPDRRAAILLQLSDFDPPTHNVPESLLNKRFKILSARPDMKAAVARAGGTRRIHLQVQSIW